MITRSVQIAAGVRLSVTLERAWHALVIALLISMRPLAAQEFVSRAKELYEAADYEEALKVLDAAGEDTGTPDQRQSAREYRALCLLALDRTEDMAETIERMVQSDPFFHLAPDRTPRLLLMFDRIHRRLLPSIVRERYSEAKANLDKKRYADASAGFELVLRLIKEAADASNGEPRPDDQWLADLQPIVTQSIDAIRVAQEPPAVAKVETVHPDAETAYRSADRGVTPPIPVRQDIPPWQSVEPGPAPFNGELELLIDAHGDVREARITVPIHPAYDPVIVHAAEKWKYRPATKDGQPVTYYKSIAISLMPRTSPATPANRR